MKRPSTHTLLQELLKLRKAILSESKTTFSRWQPHLQPARPRFAKSALNFAHYLALRHHDLRDVQGELRLWGLSSLGRIEAQVLPTLDSVIASLADIAHEKSPVKRPTPHAFRGGERLLDRETRDVFGAKPRKRRVRMMVTLPLESADDPSYIKELLMNGMNIARINCAHDTPHEWEKMIIHLRQAEAETGLSCRVSMDLGGPKSRTADVAFPDGGKKVRTGDLILLYKDTPTPYEGIKMQVRCTLSEAVDQVKVGASIFFDDGKIEAGVQERIDGGVILCVTHAHPDGDKLKDDKGINFPNTSLQLVPLTPKDIEDLSFVAAHADMVNYSFVQSGDDVRLLQAEIAKLKPTRPIALIAKIETAKAVKHLPEIIIAAGGTQPFGVMIARGDLAIEIGFERMAEIQEEILWLCEAAHVPVIWATQVLETLAKEGRPSRAEVTDAAMSERAECVMLNKGDYILDAMRLLNGVLERMETHQTKKIAQLRALKSW